MAESESTVSPIINQYCKPNKEFMANVFLLVIFIATFLSVFFFTYASNIEKQIVENQVDYILNDFLSPVSLLSPQIKTQIGASISTITPPNMTQEDNLVAQHNSAIEKKVFITIGIILVVGLIIIFIMSKKCGFSFKKLLINNLIILTFIGLTEFCFLTFLAQYFKSGDPNHVKATILKILQTI